MKLYIYSLSLSLYQGAAYRANLLIGPDFPCQNRGPYKILTVYTSFREWINYPVNGFRALTSTQLDQFTLGIMTEQEMQIMKRVQQKTNKPVGWVPMAWSINLINEMRKNKFIGNSHTFAPSLNCDLLFRSFHQISDDKGHEKLLMEIKRIESANYKLKCLVWINFPIIYTQVYYCD